MQPEDLEAVYQLECASQSEPWSRQHFIDEINNPVASVDLYWCGATLTGFLCTWLVAGELQVQNLVTLPEFRRRGIAARLLEYAITRGSRSDLTAIWLEVRAGNVAAIALYERFGFKVSGTRLRYYPDGEDALVMVCELDSD